MYLNDFLHSSPNTTPALLLLVAVAVAVAVAVGGKVLFGVSTTRFGVLVAGTEPVPPSTVVAVVVVAAGSPAKLLGGGGTAGFSSITFIFAISLI
uniref:Putative secreted peptide n=1 Tax=Anopheles braziliensis TaxID=58242 RepID=A0A2M3ZP81_9DIPT